MEIIGNYINKYLEDTIKIINKIDRNKIFEILFILRNLKGRLFILGVGGGAGNASHAVNDFRKIMNIEAYTPMDNISEYSAYVNDCGHELSFKASLVTSKLNSNDIIMVFSVGGGNDKTSQNIVKALEYGKEVGCIIIGIVGKADGYTARVADVCLITPHINKNFITPHTEEIQSIVWHLLVNYK